MRLFSKSLLVLGSLALLAGCESESNPGVTATAANPDIVSVKLAQAADKASQALDSIAGIEQMRAPMTPPPDDFSRAPPALIQPVTVRWSGPIESITRALAERAGMRFRVKGNVPPVPVTVNVDAYQQPILGIMRDLGLQAGHRADVNVDVASGVVEVAYAPADKSQ